MGLLSGILDSVGGFLSHGGEKKAAKQNKALYGDAQAGAVSGFAGARDASVAGFQPFMQGGTQAFGNALNMQTPGFQYQPSDPSYQFRLREGENALMRQQAATGGAQSGGALKALTRYGQGMASTEFANDFARNNQLAQYGLQGAQGNATAQNNYAQGNALSLFRGADGVSGANLDKAKASGSQWGDVANGISSVGKFFGF